MRVVDRETFLALPAGTLYSKFQPDYFEAVEIKGETTPTGKDFWSQDISGAITFDDMFQHTEACDSMRVAGASVPMDFETECRDGCFDADQLFAVWEKHDVQALIIRLGRALSEGYSS